ncbi:MAG: DNA repair protein RecN [Actinomycetota bacterium]|nr:DNA repair protein RecN [Actinomycetota bacterium]
MLKKLQVKNFAIIDDAELTLGNGLCVLTGETGAGKTLIIEAINLLIGERADSSLIRDNQDKLLVQGFFDFTKSQAAKNYLVNAGLIDSDDQADEVIISREVNRNEKNRAFINGIFVQVATLKELGSIFIDIHGQHDHQYLLNKKNHLEVVDKYGKREIEDKKHHYREALDKYQKIKKQLEQLQKMESAKEEKLNDLRYRLEEIEALNIQEGEQQKLEQERKILRNYEVIFQHISESVNLIKGEEDREQTLINNMGLLHKSLDSLAEIDNQFSQFEQEVSSAGGMLDELSHFLNSYLADFEYDPQRLDFIQERLFKLDEVKSKYSMTLSELKIYALDLKKQIDNYSSLEDQLKDLKKELTSQQKDVANKALNLSEIRKEISKELEERITRELNDLNFKNVVFNICQDYLLSDNGIMIGQDRVKLAEKGIDDIEFQVSLNLGEQPKPLSKVASGGEVSRVMLALKSIIGSVDSISVMIFDEIDVGIGGAVSLIVGEKLYKISTGCQVICITHLAQIAAFGQHNFAIEKYSREGGTKIKITRLSGDQKTEEIARMLSGMKNSNISIKHARELIDECSTIKHNIDKGRD